jgi:hypothetical protein
MPCGFNGSLFNVFDTAALFPVHRSAIPEWVTSQIIPTISVAILPLKVSRLLCGTSMLIVLQDRQALLRLLATPAAFGKGKQTTTQIETTRLLQMSAIARITLGLHSHRRMVPYTYWRDENPILASCEPILIGR